MNRRKQRKQAFVLLFQNLFTGDSASDIIESAELSEDTQVSDFSKEILSGVIQNRETIREYIKTNAGDWRIDRISRVAMAIMEISIYEMLFRSDIPVEISINEAIELAKKYGGKDEFVYVNGVLGSVNKQINEDKAK